MLKTACILLSLELLCCSSTSDIQACNDHEDALETDNGADVLELSLLQTGLSVQEGGRQAGKLTVREWMDKQMGADTKSGSPRRYHESIPNYVFIVAMSTLLLAAALVAYFGGHLNAAAEILSPQKDAISEKLESEKDANTSPAPSAAEGDAAAGGASAGATMKPELWLVLFFVIGHSISASSLTVVNKVAMNQFHPPADQTVAGGVVDKPRGYVWTLVLIQFLFAVVVTWVAGAVGLVKVDPLRWRPALAYFPAAGMFMVTIVAGNAVMNFTNVNTFLILRSLVPVPCALLETGLYSDPCPPMLSWFALGITIFGAGLYATSIGGFEMNSIAWAAIFLVTMPIDGLLIKHSISNSKLSAWGLVYYNNVLASIPLIVYVFLFELPSMEAVKDMGHALKVPEAQTAVLISCGAGVCISFFQLNTRYYISATAFMILGVVNKFLTVLWSEVFLGGAGFKALCGCLMTLGGAVCWQIIMGNHSVKLRARTSQWENNAALPFLLTLAALVWAAWVQHSTSPSS